MDNEKIEEGDIVDISLWGVSGYGNVKVLHTPQDTGDMWRIKTGQGKIIYINSNCSGLLEISLISKQESK